MSADPGADLASTVAELEQLFAEEASALKKLDHSRFDELTQRKVALTEKLRAAFQASSPGDRELLQRLRNAALLNQMLLVHARDTMRGLLGLGKPARAPSGRINACG